MYDDVVYYQIKKGDYPYKIAKKYNIPLDVLLHYNPHIDATHLQVGSYLLIPVTHTETDTQFTVVKDKMRNVFDPYIFWLRGAIVSSIDHLGDETTTSQRVLQTANDLETAFEPFYGKEITNEIKYLFTNHITLTMHLVQALLQEQTNQATQINNQWHQNANSLASLLSQNNPKYSEESLKNLLFAQLDMIKTAILSRLQKNYQQETITYDTLIKQAQTIADYLSNGLYQ